MDFEINKIYSMMVIYVDAKGRYVNVLAPDKKSYRVDIEGTVANGIKSLKDKRVELIYTGESIDVQPNFMLSPKYFAKVPSEPKKGSNLGLLEGLKVEFKKSIIFSSTTHQPGSDKLMEIAREIAAFMNTEGGVLYCGVDDEANVVGIENDLKVLGKATIKGCNGKTDAGWGYEATADGFSQKLRNLIRFYLGDFASTLVQDPEFLKDEQSGHTYVKVKVNPAVDEFVYLGPHENVYYRTGTSSVLLEGRSREQYAKARFKSANQKSFSNLKCTDEVGRYLSSNVIKEEHRNATPSSLVVTGRGHASEVSVQKCKDPVALLDEIRNSLKTDFDDYRFETCQLFRNGESLPSEIALKPGWEWAIVVKIVDSDRERIMREITSFIRIDIEPIVSGQYGIWCRFANRFSSNTSRKAQLKTTVFLPNWFVEAVAEREGTEYRTDRLGVRKNLESSEAKCRNYLGTYAPRSFAEMVSFADYAYALYPAFKASLKSEVSILDVGCGSGAATFGFLWSLKKARLPNLRKVTVWGVDGNAASLILFADLMSAFRLSWSSLAIELKTIVTDSPQCAITKKAMGEIDVALSSKFLQELGNSEKCQLVDDAVGRVLSSTGMSFWISNPGIDESTDVFMQTSGDDCAVVAEPHVDFLICGLKGRSEPIKETVSLLAKSNGKSTLMEE